MNWLVGTAAVLIFYGTCVLIDKLTSKRKPEGEYEEDHDGIPWGDV